MTLIAKPTEQQSRGPNRIVHCQVLERGLIELDGVAEPGLIHRPDLDFDVVVAADCCPADLKLAIAKRLADQEPVPVAPGPVALPAALTLADAKAFIPVREAEQIAEREAAALALQAGAV